MRRLLRLVVLLGLAVWAWRSLVGRREPSERASVSYADGSSIVLEAGSAGFQRLAAVARVALRT
ncbi:MAG TPA: hypothetical protein VK926_09585 [Gaiellaceae bacterium]|nr:hypothetical protein [Gaiellaceae bacterium]